MKPSEIIYILSKLHSEVDRAMSLLSDKCFISGQCLSEISVAALIMIESSVNLNIEEFNKHIEVIESYKKDTHGFIVVGNSKMAFQSISDFKLSNDALLDIQNIILKV